MTDKVLLKDILFNKAKVEHIAGEIQRVYPSFKKDRFVRDVLARFSGLELKARISWIAGCLKAHLPGDYRQAVNVILKSLPEPNNPDLSDGDFGDFIYAPYADYIARHGCNAKNLDFSLRALRTLTMRFSAEDAIRYFINAFPKQTLAALTAWSKDSHYHVRRLCSEGTRPKLPWSQKINIPVAEPLSILDNLFFDKTRFVTRSVANHINDISKIDPDLAISALVKWKKSGKQPAQEMDYIIRHALRTLIKQGHRDAMRLLGISHAPQVNVTNFKALKKVPMNSALEFSFDIQAKKDTGIIADYIIYFQNKAGKMSGKKVFKLKNCLLLKNEVTTFAKRHMMREHMSTRKLFRGPHEIEIQINGKSYGKKPFLIV